MSTVIRLKMINQGGQIRPLFLHLEGEKRLPAEVGTGRSAVVLLATTHEDAENTSNEYRAVKFLRNDVDKQYAAAAAARFFQEAGQAQQFTSGQGAFVRYWGWGALGSPQGGQPWWKVFGGDAQNISNDDDDHHRIREHYDFQGPFYVMTLCQGTLHDLLDRDKPWPELPPYTIHDYKTQIDNASREIQSDIRNVVERYFDKHPSGMSGYDILNAFKTNETANRIRNRAVLELFFGIADTVAKLHSRTNRDTNQDEPLAHRDLKPGNIFFEHGSDAIMGQIAIKLGDLGYVVTPSGIQLGEMTIIAGRRGTEYLAPGSQFFRAPEQAELPIEVRVDVALNDTRMVEIRGSKISYIDIHDWLSISDIFGTARLNLDQASNDLFDNQELDSGRAANVFKILKVLPDLERNAYKLTLDGPVQTSKEGDLQGQITRATGFHTDGFSLGAILYDLISGGRNPELFYTYCLATYTNQLGLDQGVTYTADHVVDMLYPRPPDYLKYLSFRNTQGTQGRQVRLSEYLRHFVSRDIEDVRDLLTDKRGVRIPRDILEVIVKCMLRDVEGCYYRRDPDQAFLWKGSYQAAALIRERIKEMLARPEYQWAADFPFSLQQNLLFKLRSLARRDAEHG